MTTFIYFIRSGATGPIKIGIARNPRRRLALLQTGNPEPLALLAIATGTDKHERFLHWTFAEHRGRGEWFSPNAALLGLIASVAATGEIPNPPPHLWPELRRAKDILGSESAVADAVGVKQPSVNYILNSGKRVPAEWCLPLERATKGVVTRSQLRPDLYPPEEEAAA